MRASESWRREVGIGGRVGTGRFGGVEADGALAMRSEIFFHVMPALWCVENLFRRECIIMDAQHLKRL